MNDNLKNKNNIENLRTDSSLFEKEMLYDNNEVQPDKKDFNLSLSRIKNDNNDVDAEETINNSNMHHSQ